jgi:hypothetical protein
MKYRKLDANGDKVWGQGLSCFWINVPDAVAQLVDTRLRLWLGQWFLFLTDGTPWQTQVLGRYTITTRDPAIQGRILQTPGVTGLENYSSNLNRNTRDWTAQGTVNTSFGAVPFVVGPFPANVPVSQGR